jgi:hypothetical protein
VVAESATNAESGFVPQRRIYGEHELAKDTYVGRHFAGSNHTFSLGDSDSESDEAVTGGENQPALGDSDSELDVAIPSKEKQPAADDSKLSDWEDSTSPVRVASRAPRRSSRRILSDSDEDSVDRSNSASSSNARALASADSASATRTDVDISALISAAQMMQDDAVLSTPAVTGQTKTSHRKRTCSTAEHSPSKSLRS